MAEVLYTHKEKGGKYIIIAYSIGAGKSRGEEKVTYVSIDSGLVFHRSREDFKESMKEIK